MMKFNFFAFMLIALFFSRIFADPIAIVIDTPGSYNFYTGIEADPTDPDDSIIRISASNVFFDLGNYRLTTVSGNTVSGLSGIVVDDNLENIVIRHGVLEGLSGYGIKVGDGCKNVTIEEMTIKSCNAGGIFFDAATGSSNVGVKKSFIATCTGVNGQPAFGLRAINCEDIFCIESVIEGNDAGTSADGFGIMLQSCAVGKFLNCCVTQNGGNERGCGIFLENSSDCVFQECLVANNKVYSNSPTAFGGGLCIEGGQGNFVSESLIVSNDKDGIELTDVDGVTVVGVKSCRNVENGFELSGTSTACFFKASTAFSNNGFGFLNTSTGLNMFYNNISYGNNSDNFSGVPEVTSHGSARSWFQNIDSSAQDEVNIMDDIQQIIIDSDNQTFTVLETIKNSLNTCCAEIESDIFDTQTIVCEKINDLENSLAACCNTIEDISLLGCDTIITQADIGVGGTYSITVPGVYCLVEDISFSAGAAITIAASNVTLNLKNHTLTGASGTTGILISAGSTLQNVCLFDGTIVNVATGVSVSDTRNSNCYNLRIINYTSAGFNITASAQRIFCENCVAQAASTTSTTGFLFASTTANCCLNTCKAFGNQDGFSINGSAHLFTKCVASSNGRDGFRIAGTNHVLKENVANLNTTDGIHILVGTTNCEIRENSANNNTGRGFNDQTATFVVLTGFNSSNTVVKNISQSNTGGNYDAATLNIVSLITNILSANAWVNISRT